MESEVFSGNGNFSYTNNKSQNIRVIINFMNATQTNEITLSWAGVSIVETDVEAIGKNIAAGTAFYGDYFAFPSVYWKWWYGLNRTSNARAAITTQNCSIKMPVREIDFSKPRRGWWWWWYNEAKQEMTGFSLSVALPTEIFLKPGQTFNAVCGAYNIVAIPEN